MMMMSLITQTPSVNEGQYDMGGRKGVEFISNIQKSPTSVDESHESVYHRWINTYLYYDIKKAS